MFVLASYVATILWSFSLSQSDGSGQLDSGSFCASAGVPAIIPDARTVTMHR